MVNQCKTSKKCSRKGLRRSLRLSNSNSRPKLDIVFEKSQPKSQTKTSQSADDGYNLRTRPPFPSGAKSSFSRNSQEDRSRRRNLLVNSKLSVKSWLLGLSQSSIIGDNIRTRSQLHSKANNESSFLESSCLSTNEAKLGLSSFAKNSLPPSQAELFTENMCRIDQMEAPEFLETEFQDILSTSTPAGDDLKLLPPLPALLKMHSHPDECAAFGDHDNDSQLQPQPFKNYLHSADGNVRPRRQHQERNLKCSRFANVPRKADDNAKKKSQKMKKEFINAARSFESEPKKTNTTVSQRIRHPRKVNKINPEKDEEKTNAMMADDNKQSLASDDIEENWSSVDELCTQFETCEFTSNPKYLVDDQKLSSHDCLLNPPSSNVMFQKFNELKGAKSGKANKQIPNLIPVIFKPGIGATIGGDSTINSLPDSVEPDEYVEIHNILNSITHVCSKIPSYEPFEENWYEGFDVWSK